MLHKMGYEYVCEYCEQPKQEDDIADFENGICVTCDDKERNKQEAYWRPLYDGEKLAGLLPDNHYK